MEFAAGLGVALVFVLFLFGCVIALLCTWRIAEIFLRMRNETPNVEVEVKPDDDDDDDDGEEWKQKDEPPVLYFGRN